MNKRTNQDWTNALEVRKKLLDVFKDYDACAIMDGTTASLGVYLTDLDEEKIEIILKKFITNLLTVIKSGKLIKDCKYNIDFDEDNLKIYQTAKNLFNEKLIEENNFDHLITTLGIILTSEYKSSILLPTCMMILHFAIDQGAPLEFKYETQKLMRKIFKNIK